MVKHKRNRVDRSELIGEPGVTDSTIDTVQTNR